MVEPKYTSKSLKYDFGTLKRSNLDPQIFSVYTASSLFNIVHLRRFSYVHKLKM